MDMILHSTIGKSPKVSLSEGIANGLAPDGGLYMPDEFPCLPSAFFKNIHEMTLKEIAFVICNTLFGNQISAETIKKMVDEALNFDIPLRKVEGNKYVLELYHGPTLSFKDVGARFMSRLLPAIAPTNLHRNILLATSGDSGGAVANAFSHMAGVTVYVLFPNQELTKEQVMQFASLPNVVAVEVDGNFDDCQHLVKEALRADAVSNAGRLTSGNSINLARELPAIIYFFHAYARALEQEGADARVVISVPCGNLGSLSAALMAKKMGLPVERFIAANNANDVFVEYLKTGGFRPQRALLTLARAMDVGNPSNIARIVDLYGGNMAMLRKDVEGYAYSDDEISETMKDVAANHGLIIDPQGATALRALMRHVPPHEVGVALASAHPAKFRDTVEAITGVKPDIPSSIHFMANVQNKIRKIPPSSGALHRILSMR